ncbi:O-antigen ligase [Thioalkalivibrio sp. ALJ15]|uniref:O-antigen ligase family protein n=1 Tax=Thioalkalivibrio sp. ALJ15 TaxID=748652 RepID=UPI00036BE536|nr:O-antigen ligase family protein [Thioalkalivibrio sp. ALJ15]
MMNIHAPASIRNFLPEDTLGLWAVGALYAGAFVAPLSISLGQAFQLLLLILGILFVRRNWAYLKGSPLIWLPVAFAAYVVLRTVFAALFERPDLATSHWDEMATWMKTAIVPVLIYGLALAATGNWLRHGLVTVALLMAGYCVYLAMHLSPADLVAALQTTDRYNMELGFRSSAIKLPAIITGLVITTVFFFATLSSATSQTRWSLLLGSSLFSLALLAFFIASIIATKSRNGWLTLAIALVAVLALSIWAYRRDLHRIRGALLGAMVAMLLAAGTLTTFSWDHISERWEQTADTVQQTIALPFHGNVEELERDSVGIRVAYWAFAWERFLDRPLVGRGAADQRHLTEEFPIPPQLEDRDDTFHNSHLDILVRFGLVGYGMIAIFTVFLAVAAWRMLGVAGGTRAIGIYTLAFLPALFFWAMNAQLLHRYTMEHFYGPILALSFAFAISEMLTRNKPESPRPS